MRPALIALVRLAARDARRDRWRTLLVVVMVALPVAGLVGAIALADSMAPTEQERATSVLGMADAIVEPTGDATGAADLAAAAAGILPPGTQIDVVSTASTGLVVDGISRPGLSVTDAPLDPQAPSAGRIELTDGRPPEHASEVAATAAVLERAGARVGDTIELDALGTLTVVGEVRVPESLSSLLTVTMPGVLDEAWPTAFVVLPPGETLPQPSPRLIVDTVDDWGTAELMLTSRAHVLSQRFTRGERVTAIVVGGLAAVEVALIAGAAFAVSVRRRQRELGLLAAVGGSMAHVRRAVVLIGVVGGALGAFLGVFAGAAAALATTPWLDGWADRITGGVRLDPVWLAVSAALGFSAAVLGASWPARGVARLPVVVALSGRRPTTTPARTGLRAGVALATAGVIVCVAGTGLARINPYVFLLGAVLVVLGAGLCSPWLLERIGRLAPRLPTGPRLAVRDAARFRTRNGPIVTAAMAGLAASITIATVLGSMSALERASYRPQLPVNIISVVDWGAEAAAAAIGRELGLTPHPLATATGGGVVLDGGASPTGQVYPDGYREIRADPALAGALYGDEAGAAIAAGRAVVVTADASITSLTFEPLVDIDTWEAGPPVELPVTVVAPPWGTSPQGAPTNMPSVLIPEAHAGVMEPNAFAEYLLVLDRPVVEADLEVAADIARLYPDVWVTAEEGYIDYNAATRRIALLLCAVFGLAIVTVALALAGAEGRADQRMLLAVGAAPRLRRSLAAGRALVLAGLGGWLAVPVGLVPAYALIATSGRGLPFVLPWTAIGVVAGLVPLVALIGALVFTRGTPAWASPRT